MFLLSRKSGPMPHTANIIIQAAGTNLSTSGLPCKTLYDLHNTKN